MFTVWFLISVETRVKSKNNSKNRSVSEKCSNNLTGNEIITIKNTKSGRDLRCGIICTYSNQFWTFFPVSTEFRFVSIFDFLPKWPDFLLDFIHWWSWHRNYSNEMYRRTISGFVSDDFYVIFAIISCL